MSLDVEVWGSMKVFFVCYDDKFKVYYFKLVLVRWVEGRGLEDKG